MNRDGIDRFCAQVCEQVRFRPDHAAIRAELAAHWEDHAAALMERGIPEEEAARRALEAMGDPGEIGKELDRSHSPFLGWFQICFRVFAWAAALAAAIVLVSWLFNRGGISYLTTDVEEKWVEQGLLPWTEHVVADFHPDAVFRGEDYTFSVRRALLIEQDNTEIRRLSCLVEVTWTNPWLPSPDMRYIFRAEDNLGNEYGSFSAWYYDYPDLSSDDAGYCDGTGLADSLTPFSVLYDMTVWALDPDAEEITLILDRFGTVELALTIPLREEAPHG